MVHIFMIPAAVIVFNTTNRVMLNDMTPIHCSEITPEGRRITKLDQILLNGNNIAIIRNLIF
ncbi:hypothetical protein R6Q57_007817 [Mikania cordata]